jgi:transcriptional regulator with XRE-family HTH domain
MPILLISKFNGRKKDISVIELRYLHGLTLELTGKKLGLSRERVRQIEERAIIRLQNAFNISLRRVCPEIPAGVDGYYTSEQYRKKLRHLKLDKEKT